jgi:putative transcriptional regulator
MTPRHHPSEALIAACAAGTLRPGAALIVRAHLASCPVCRQEAGFYESLGGALLQTEPAAALAPDALERTLAAIDRPPTTTTAAPRGAHDVVPLLRDLGGVTVGRRRMMAPGVWMRPVRTDQGSRELVYLLRIGPGMVLPRHTHKGCEFTCVLEGSFSDASGRYEAGDFVATDETTEHGPVVGRDQACICLISTDAPLVMRDLIGRLFQPLAGI